MKLSKTLFFISLARIKKFDKDQKVWQYIILTRVWGTTVIHCWWECKLVQSFWRVIEQYLSKMTITLTQHQIYPTETYIQRYMWRILIAALQQQKMENNQNVYQQGDGYVNCNISTKCNSIEPLKRMMQSLCTDIKRASK